MNHEQEINEGFRAGMGQMKIISRSYKKKGLSPINAHRGHMRASLFCLGAAIHADTQSTEITMQILQAMIVDELPILKELLNKANEANDGS